MQFPYKKLKTGALRPIIPIVVVNPATAKRIKYFTLVDSGADISIFDAVIGELIGLDIEAGEEKFLQGVVEGVMQQFYLH